MDYKKELSYAINLVTAMYHIREIRLKMDLMDDVISDINPRLHTKMIQDYNRIIKEDPIFVDTKKRIDAMEEELQSLGG